MAENKGFHPLWTYYKSGGILPSRAAKNKTIWRGSVDTDTRTFLSQRHRLRHIRGPLPLLLESHQLPSDSFDEPSYKTMGSATARVWIAH
jgi:hypothetical protein